jgi:hypothetical protein
MSMLVVVDQSLWKAYESQLKGQETLIHETERLSLNNGEQLPMYAE